MKEALSRDAGAAKKAKTYQDAGPPQVPYLQTPAKAAMIKQAFDMKLLVPDGVGVQTALRIG